MYENDLTLPWKKMKVENIFLGMFLGVLFETSKIPASGRNNEAIVRFKPAKPSVLLSDQTYHTLPLSA